MANFWRRLKDKVAAYNRRALLDAADIADLERRGRVAKGRFRVPRPLSFDFVRRMKAMASQDPSGRWAACANCEIVDCIRMGGDRRPSRWECPYWYRF